MYICFIILFIFLADQLTKKYVSEKIPEGVYHEVIKDKLYITNLKNKGAAYGLLSGKPKALMLCTAASVLWAVSGLYRVLKNKGDFLEKLMYACLLGGAAGNIADRIRLKQVTDFIFIKPKSKINAPIFNVADAFILIGALLYVVKSADSEFLKFLKGKQL